MLRGGEILGEMKARAKWKLTPICIVTKTKALLSFGLDISNNKNRKFLKNCTISFYFNKHHLKKIKNAAC